jgi:two-component system, NtrC family, response regulator GlrR
MVPGLAAAQNDDARYADRPLPKTRSAWSGEHSTAALRHDAPPPLPIAALVRVLDAPAAPAVFRLGLGNCVIGAGSEAHVVISEPTVSRKHAELTLVPEGVLVRDIGSRNGTFYLGQRVEKIVLALGSRIKLGAVEIALDADPEALSERLPDDEHSYRGLVGASASMRRLFAVLKRLEGSLVNVLIQGESGTGKELVARAIHEGSSRATRAMVVVNCGGIARELILSELFGHRRGAFTGAIDDRVGAFAAADGGTLFFDEIGELPLELQPTLLRALESGEVRPVGGNEARRVRVRVIAATNRDLETDVQAGRFRGDLYYRLAVVKLALPPLRERPDDIELLSREFALSAGLAELPAEIAAELAQQPWPGNARELRNAIQAYVALGTLTGRGESTVSRLEQALGQHIDVSRPYAEQKEDVAERFTRKYLELLLAETGGNQSKAARISGIERSYLGKLVARYGIKR